MRVVTIVTGGIKSNIARTDRQLPEDSYYIPLNEEYQRRLKHSQEGAMPSDDYAKSVVSKVLKSSPPKWVWEGNKSWAVWFLSNFLPKGIMVSLAQNCAPKLLLIGARRMPFSSACSTCGSSLEQQGRRRLRRAVSRPFSFPLSSTVLHAVQYPLCIAYRIAQPVRSWSRSGIHCCIEHSLNRSR